MVALPVVGVQTVGRVHDGFVDAGVLGLDLVAFCDRDLGEECLVALAFLTVVPKRVYLPAVGGEGEVGLDAEPRVGASGFERIEPVGDVGELLGDLLLFPFECLGGDGVVVEHVDEFEFGVLEFRLLGFELAPLDGGVFLDGGEDLPDHGFEGFGGFW